MKKLFAFAVSVLLACGLYAQDAAQVAMPFSAIPRNVRTLSMGGISSGEDVAVRIFGEDKLDASLSWYSWAPSSAASNDINADVFARLGQRLGLSAQFALDNGPRYDIYNETGVKGGFFVPKDMMFKLGASYRILPSLSAGATFRYMNSSLTSKVSYSAVAADVIAAYDLGPAKVAAGVTNLGTSVKAADGTAFGIPTAATVAGDWSMTFAEKHSIDVKAQIDWFFKGGLRAGAGAEYGFADMAFLRVGYSYGGKSPFPSFLSLGVGGKFSGISINAAYLLGDKSIGGTLALGAGYSF